MEGVTGNTLDLTGIAPPVTYLPVPPQCPCPCCNYCPHCGRSGYSYPVPPRTYVPYAVPYVPYVPPFTYCSDGGANSTRPQ